MQRRTKKAIRQIRYYTAMSRPLARELIGRFGRIELCTCDKCGRVSAVRS